jgi:ubiquitin carboxyl-terminal hydrolase 4/11/15
MIITKESALGKVGLQNLGNTCFMNSCLQCLSNCVPLTEYFLKKYYVKEINEDNPLGSKGKLAKNYAKFIKNMWCESNSTYSPHNLKAAVAKLNPIFSGYAQHDSQEFFSFLVDGLHEDLNRIKKKPYVESIDSKGRPDK